MPLRRIDIANLKSLGTNDGEPHQIPLAPITLVYGPNSAGKSTIVQALSLMRELILQDLGPRDCYLPTHTELFDFGSFRSAVHRHDTTLSLFLGVLLDAPADQSAYVGLEFGGSPSKLDEDPPRGALRGAAVGSARQTLQFKLDRNKRAFRLAGSWKQPLMRLIEEATSEDDEKTLSILKAGTRARRAAPKFPLTTGAFPAIPEREYISDADANRLFHSKIDSAVDARVRAVRSALKATAYLGPLRAAPTRLQTLTSERPMNVGPVGEHTASVLYHGDNPKDKLIEHVNSYLVDLEIPYELRVDRISVDRDDPTHNAVDVSDVVAITLVDKRPSASGRSSVPVTVSPRDVGFGVSQVLPVVVQCAAATDSLICIEQPEVHIHPRLQARLGELFVTSAEKNRNQFLIETHSEHLMLRLQRLIRRGHGWLTPDKIAVIYVDVHPDGSARPLHLPLDADGEFTAAWPDGFFTERLEEVFGDDTDV